MRFKFLARPMRMMVCGLVVLANLVPFASAQVPYGAGYNDQSEYALGTYVWNIVFLETPEDPWDSGVLSARKDRIEEAANFWEEEANLDTRFLDDIDWLNFTVNYANGGVPLVLDEVGGESDFSYYDEALGMLDPSYDSGGATTAARTYNDAMRTQFGTNWSFTTFVRNYSGRASAYVNGPLTNAFSDDPWGTYAHEVGHIFGALDEYEGASNTGAQSGYLYTYNTNSLNNPDGTTNTDSYSSLMRTSGSTVLSTGTIDAIGWRDEDDDGIPDILDTHPTFSEISISDPAPDALTFELDAVVTPLPSPNPSVGDFTINTLDSATYRVNDGSWIEFNPTDGNWGDYQEDLDFTVSGLTEPINKIEFQVVNSVTNFTHVEYLISPNGELPGDANRDGYTNATDIQIWQSNYGATDLASWDTGDFDLNGIVDGQDYLILQRTFGKQFFTLTTDMEDPLPPPRLVAVAVPEPTSLVMLITAFELLWLRRISSLI